MLYNDIYIVKVMLCVVFFSLSYTAYTVSTWMLLLQTILPFLSLPLPGVGKALGTWTALARASSHAYDPTLQR